ncbi:MAG: TonB-dependent receptor, partial [Sphingomonas sp.]
MSKRRAYGTLLLLTSTLVAPAALAQTAPAPAAPPRPAATPQAEADQTNAATPGTTAQEQTTQQATPQAAPEAGVEVSSPGYDAAAGEDIVVVGRNIPNTVRSTAQVISVLSTDDIARTGEGDIADALTRVTGLSVVGNGFVFVRGLGDRYSSSLLN